jgi:ADP-ribose pyrophosphatase YjhB (NUDIX family)
MRGERNVSDLERFEFGSGGERRVVEWQPPDVAPAGRRHRSAGVCFASDGRVVIVGEDGELWGLPGGRPEGDEGWRDTFEREVQEEACAVVGDAALLGFGRSVCLEGVERGLVLVRALWRAEVELQDWAPRFETVARELVAPQKVAGRVAGSGGVPRGFYERWVREARSAG